MLKRRENTGHKGNPDENGSRLSAPIGYHRKHGGLPPAKKTLGQNWLEDSAIAAGIIKVLAPSPGEPILEVGPGGGALTAILLEAGAEVTAVEIDRRMIAVLEKRFAGKHRFRVIHADILRSDFHELMNGRRFSIVGNLPYHITSSLLFGAMDHARLYPGSIRKVVVMVQKEVAERIVSPPGHSKYGILSVFLRLWCEPELAMEVSRHSFRPAPKVDAGVLNLELSEQLRFPLPHWPTFKRLVKGTFHKRRKMLRNSLPGIANIGPWQELEFDWTRRPQTLSVAEFSWLAERLIPNSIKSQG